MTPLGATYAPSGRALPATTPWARRRNGIEIWIQLGSFVARGLLQVLARSDARRATQHKGRPERCGNSTRGVADQNRTEHIRRLSPYFGEVPPPPPSHPFPPSGPLIRPSQSGAAGRGPALGSRGRSTVCTCTTPGLALLRRPWLGPAFAAQRALGATQRGWGQLVTEAAPWHVGTFVGTCCESARCATGEQEDLRQQHAASRRTRILRERSTRQAPATVPAAKHIGPAAAGHTVKTSGHLDSRGGDHGGTTSLHAHGGRE